MVKRPKLKKFDGIMKNFFDKLCQELQEKCTTMISTIENKCIPLCGTNSEAIAFFYCMEGDFYRYQIEAMADGIYDKVN